MQFVQDAICLMVECSIFSWNDAPIIFLNFYKAGYIWSDKILIKQSGYILLYFITYIFISGNHIFLSIWQGVTLYSWHRSPQLKKIKTEKKLKKKLKILEKNWKKTEKKLKKLKYKNAIFSTVYVEKFRFLLVCGKTDTKANFCPKDIILVAPVWAQYSKL